MNFRAWFFLFRPWSYTATIVPFCVAAALAHRFFPDVACDWWWGAIAFVAGFFFQATVNLLNTWGDERSGVDDVPGAIRTTPQVHEGAVSMRALLGVALLCAGIAGGLGVAICVLSTKDGWVLNWPLLIAGFIGFLGATNYSTLSRFKYRGLGVPFVSLLMGPIEIFVFLAVLVPFTFPPFIPFLLLTLPIALLVGVIMHGNDMRDIPTDRAAGIQSFASRLGVRGAFIYFWFCHVAIYVECVILGLFGKWLFFITFLALPLSIRVLKSATAAWQKNPKLPPWRGLERGSGGVHFVFGILYAIALYYR